MRFLSVFLVALATAGCVRAEERAVQSIDDLMCFVAADLRFSAQEDPNAINIGEMVYFLGRMDASRPKSVTPRELKARIRKMGPEEMKAEIRKCRLIYVNRFELMFDLSAEVGDWKDKNLKGTPIRSLFEGEVF